MTKLSLAVLLVSCSLVRSQFPGGLAGYTTSFRRFTTYKYPFQRGGPYGSGSRAYNGESNMDGRPKCYTCIGCNDPFQYAMHTPIPCDGLCVSLRALEDSPLSIQEIRYKEGDIIRDCFCVDKLCGLTRYGRYFEIALQEENKLNNDSSDCQEEETMGHKFDACYCNRSLCNGSVKTTVSNGSGELSVSMATVMMAVAAVLTSYI